MWIVVVFLGCVGFSLAQPWPTGSNLDNIVTAAFHKVDHNNNNVVVRDELAGFPKFGDLNHDGCMSVDEYKKVTAGTPQTAEKIFHTLDPNHTNCLNYDKISPQFDIMDVDKSGTANLKEFSDWYTNLIFGHPVAIVG